MPEEPPTQSPEEAMDHWERARARARRALFGNVALAFGLVSFLPPLNLVALALGAIGFRRSGPGRARSTFALVSGSFFTVLFLVVALGARWAPQRAAGAAGMEEQIGELCRSDRPEAREHCRAAFYGLVDRLLPGAEAALKNALAADPDLPGAKTLLAAAASGRIIHPGQDKILLVLVLLIAFVFHEYAHARTAHACGDDTASHLGRLSLNPFVHLDPIGSVLLPAFLIMRGGGMLIGWARPVPVNPTRFRNPSRDDALVSVAGPAANLAIACGCMLLLVTMAAVLRVFFPAALTFGLLDLRSDPLIGGIAERAVAPLVIGASLLKKCLVTNIGLAIFNLFPVPPLDGSHLLLNVLPYRWRSSYEKILPYGSFVLIAFLFSGLVEIVLFFPFVTLNLGFDGISWALGLA